MNIADTLLPEFDMEMANTRKSLERVPDGKYDYKPHPKSPTLGWLAWHTAFIPAWAVVSIQQDSLDVAPPGGQQAPPMPKNNKELLAMFDKNVKDARAAIAGAANETFMQPWTLLKGGQKLMTLPKAAVLRGFVMNHLIHHRAQLGVYLRLNDVPVPAIYGPSADEQPF